jgi:general secretion pathway protein I
MRPERRQSGFTLIEVVVAIAVVALGMMAVFRVVHDTVNNSIYLRDRTLATWIADNRLVEMRLAPELPSVDETKGEVDYANDKWEWTATVSQTQVDDLRRIDVRVRRKGGSEGSALAEVSGFVGAVAMATAPTATPWTGAAPGAPGEDGQDGQDGPQNGGSQQPALPPRPVVQPWRPPGRGDTEE